MKEYLTRQDAEAILSVMNQLPDHDAFVLEIDNLSGIGTNISLTTDIIHSGLAGKFTVEINSIDRW
jgi:hypothetical protein